MPSASTSATDGLPIITYLSMAANHARDGPWTRSIAATTGSLCIGCRLLIIRQMFVEQLPQPHGLGDRQSDPEARITID